MGAATSLLHARRDPSIAALVLDSAFADLKQLVMDLGKAKTKLPSWLLQGAMTLVKNSVQKRANFDIYQLKPIQNLNECFIPALFAYGEQDSFINPYHT